MATPLDPATHVGSLTTQEQFNKVVRYVEIGKGEGAELVAGGATPIDAGLAGGYFYLPTVFDRVKTDMRLAQEEIFGPVLSVLDFEDDEQLVTDANSTVYGLAAGLWTEDMRRALRLAQRLKAGTVWINTFRQTQISASFGRLQDEWNRPRKRSVRSRGVLRGENRLGGPQRGRYRLF